MATQLDIAKKRLFEKDALDVRNIKLFPGEDKDATPEEVASSVNKAISQIEAGDFDIIESFED